MSGETMDEMRARLAREAARKRAGLPDPEAERERDVVGAQRHAIHAGSATSRPLSKGYEQVGLAGEQAFAAFAHVAWDRTLRPGGSGGVNFTINGKTVNVYTARIPKHLLVETGKANADFHVLAGYANGQAHLIGWAHRKDVLAAPVKDWGGKGIQSHAIPANHLIPMDRLLRWFDLPAEKQGSLF